MPEIIIKLGDKVVQKYYLYKDTISVGRAPENEISIENLAVSRRHAEISQENGSYILEDLNSANGTFVNGVQVTRTELFDKDVIGIGKHKLHFYDQQAASLEGAEKTMLLTRPATTKAVLRVARGKQKDQIFQLNKVENRVGRAADNDVRLSDWFVSKYHAEIIRRGMVYVIRDLGSWRHTLVNGQMVEEQALKPGDEIQFGPKIAVLFEVKDGTSAREGSGRRPVELENVDQEPLPLAGGRPQTPLPIIGKSLYDFDGLDSNPDSPRADRVPSAESDNGSATPPIEEYVAVEAEPEESASMADRDAVPRDEWQEDSSPELEPIRLEEDSSAGAGWDEAGELAAEAFTPGDEREGWSGSEESPDRSDAFSNEGFEAEDLDADSIQAAQDVEWIEEIEAAEAVRDPASSELGEGQVSVASLDSAGLESPAVFIEKSGDRDAADIEGHEDPVAQGVAGESFDSEAGGGRVGADAPLPEGIALVDSIMDAHGDARDLDRTDVEIWAQALRNPSKVIRKQAQRQLQKLTGQVYDIEL